VESGAGRPDPIRAARRFGVFAVLALRAIERIKLGEITADETAAHFESAARTHRLRETGAYDPRPVDMTMRGCGSPNRLLDGIANWKPVCFFKISKNLFCLLALAKIAPYMHNETRPAVDAPDRLSSLARSLISGKSHRA
jgi:hypothetical protein